MGAEAGVASSQNRNGRRPRKNGSLLHVVLAAINRDELTGDES
jgi:hypothetical protein